MTEPATSYYPPRANWLSPVRRGWSALWRRLPAIPIPRIPQPISLRVFFPAVLVPGLGFRLVGRLRLAQWALSVYALAWAAFVIRLGYPEANLCFGLLLAIHASSATSVWARIFELTDLRQRVVASSVALLVLGGGLYWPMFGLSERFLVRPVATPEHVVVVASLASAQGVRRGDVVACRIDARHEGEAGNVHVVREGFMMGPVLGVPGDRIRFAPRNLFVNGQPQPRELTMPPSGELTVPGDTWFVWPGIEVTVGRVDVTEELVRLSLVPKANFVGRPFKHWFFRRQHFE